ncbi:hypothetical protein [Sphingomonas phage Kimi]|nr:hypothetical protein [Sphingomonas phage Kimi]
MHPFLQLSVALSLISIAHQLRRIRVLMGEDVKWWQL